MLKWLSLLLQRGGAHLPQKPYQKVLFCNNLVDIVPNNMICISSVSKYCGFRFFNIYLFITLRTEHIIW